MLVIYARHADGVFALHGWAYEAERMLEPQGHLGAGNDRAFQLQGTSRPSTLHARHTRDRGNGTSAERQAIGQGMDACGYGFCIGAR